MRRLVTLLLMIGLIPISAFAQQTVGGEYFFNSYLDFGKGTFFTLSPEQTQLDLDVLSAHEGLNALFLRTKTTWDNGHWPARYFYKYTNKCVETIEMEYFFDSYGVWERKKMALVSGQSEYLIDLEVCWDSMLYLRPKTI